MANRGLEHFVFDLRRGITGAGLLLQAKRFNCGLTYFGCGGVEFILQDEAERGSQFV